MSEAINTPGAAPAPVADVNPEVISSPEVVEESSSESQPEISAEGAPVSKQEAKAIAKRIKQLKIKVDGKESNETLPFEIDDSPEAVEYMTKQLQLARMAQKRASETSDYKKKLEQVGEYLQEAKGNPKKIRELMKDLNIDEKQLATMIVEEELEKQKKSPEQLQKEELETELRKLKEERDTEKKEFEAREYQRLVDQEVERYDTQINGALDKHKLPRSPAVINKFVEYYSYANKNGLDVSAEDIAPLVVEDMKAMYQEWVKTAPEDFIEELLGKDNLKKLRNHNLAKAKSAPAPLNKSVVDTGKGQKNQKGQENQKISMKEYFKNLK